MPVVYDWSKWNHLLGIMPDVDIAALIGCDRTTVGLRRRVKEIPAYSESKPINVQIECACGCGQVLWKYDRRSREREFLPHHWSRTVQPTTIQIVYCDNCGAEIRRPRWHRNKVNHHFCNHSCTAKWAAKNGIRRGKNNGMWAGGIGTFYPLKFTERLRENIRRRDDYQCQMCDTVQDELSKALDVHHKMIGNIGKNFLGR
jgi:hypothetical protein